MLATSLQLAYDFIVYDIKKNVVGIWNMFENPRQIIANDNLIQKS